MMVGERAKLVVFPSRKDLFCPAYPPCRDCMISVRAQPGRFWMQTQRTACTACEKCYFSLRIDLCVSRFGGFIFTWFGFSPTRNEKGKGFPRDEGTVVTGRGVL